MKHFQPIAALFVASIAAPLYAETLTNDSIVKLAQAGLGEKVLLAKIKASDHSFDVGTDDLLALRENGVPDLVIAEMIAMSAVKAPAEQRVAAAMDATSPDPLVPHPPGIYLLADWQSPTRTELIEATASARTRRGSIVKFVLSGGLLGASQKAMFPGVSARIETPRSRPIFYFYLDGERDGAFMPGKVYSPDAFVLVRLDQAKESRELKIGASSIRGFKGGIPEGAQIAFTYSRLSSGAFLLQPRHDLENGEYAFVVSPHAAGASRVDQGVRIFDFTVADRTGSGSAGSED